MVVRAVVDQPGRHAVVARESRARAGSRIASSAASLCCSVGSKVLVSQRALIRSISHGPRASTWGAFSAVDAGACSRGCSAVAMTAQHRLGLPMDRRRKHWGWGYEDQQPPADQLGGGGAGALRTAGLRPRGGRAARGARAAAAGGSARADPHPAGRVQRRPTPTLVPAHALGKSYVDVVRGYRGASSTLRTSSAGHGTRSSSRRCSNGARPRA